jgi:hypothetical protein
MKLRNEPLNIPLERRRYDGVLFVLACLALGILHVKPKTPEAWVAAICVMAPTLWFVLVGPSFLNNWQRRSRYAFAGWIIFAAKMAFFLFVIRTVYPYTESMIAQWLKA